MNEEALIALYVMLTGASEIVARSVLIYLDLGSEREESEAS